MRNQEKDAINMAIKRQSILETGFRLFTSDSIEKVTMNNVADACGIGVATLYRYYKTKQALVMAISAWAWECYTETQGLLPDETDICHLPPGQWYEIFVDTFIDLFRQHKDILRFNYLFHLFVQHEKVDPVQMEPYNEMMKGIARRFHQIYVAGEKDGTFREGVTEETVFCTTLHLMLAVATHYAVDLPDSPEVRKTAENELLHLKKMLISEFVSPGRCNFSGRHEQKEPEETEKKDMKFIKTYMMAPKSNQHVTASMV